MEDEHKQYPFSPNKFRFAKGYFFLILITTIILVVWQSCDIRYSQTTGWELQSRNVRWCIGSQE